MPGRPASGYLVEQGETRVWCDAGPGTYAALGDTIDLELVTAVVISHQHSDHCVDLFAAFHRWGYGQPSRSGIPLLAPQAVLDRLIGFIQPDPDHPFYRVFRLDPIEGGDDRVVGELRFSFAWMDHSVPTIGSRITDGSRVLAYTADTGSEGDWHWLAEDANLLLAEATYQEQLEDVTYPYHLKASQAGSIARRAGADQLMLTHIPPHMDPLMSVEEAEHTFDRPVDLAVPGVRRKV